ncbi:AraC family transcriptional regulator [Bosea sp. LjRoot237]|uniref:AraC family transcriptional regulator n=1 Tax=Bosea sp. LjRoot237 TaxID=3342292 RepID=UPI003ECE7D73
MLTTGCSMVRQADEAKIAWLDYRPSGLELDVEVFPFADLWRRATPAAIRATYRYTFPMLICVTEGTSTQLVDFEPVACAAGSLLVLRPGQVHSFGSGEGWDGWLILFRAEFLPALAETNSELLPVLGLDRLPNHLSLPAADFAAVTEVIGRMEKDAREDISSTLLHPLLRHQLCGLLLRLSVLHDRQTGAEAVHSRGHKRYAQFRTLVEQNYAAWHQVAAYASALGCTQRSLTRAAAQATGRTAKQVIAARIALEAKRLLAHTDLPIYLVAGSLGFDEATNFSKFFKREAGCTPAEFQQRHE